MKKLGTIGARVRALIDEVHDGSVNLAAKDLGVRQQTLALIAAGRAKNPRSESLRRISEGYGASYDWLLSGAGDLPPVLDERPSNVIPQSEFRRWYLMVAQLKDSISSELRNQLLTMPQTTFNASFYLALEKGLPQKRAQEERANQKEALRLEYRAWIHRMQSWLSMYGAAKVGAALEANADLARRGFTERANVETLEARDKRE